MKLESNSSKIFESTQSINGQSSMRINENSKAFEFAKAITYSQVEKKSKELPWCHICKINFNFEKELVNHFESSHEGEKPYKCFICRIGFSHKKPLKRHLMTVHEGKKRNHLSSPMSYQCSLCDKKLSRKDHLNYHISSVHKAI